MTRRRPRDIRREQREKRLRDREEARIATFAYLSERANRDSNVERRDKAFTTFNWFPGQVMIFNALERRFAEANPTVNVEAAWGDGTFLELFLEWLSSVDWEQVLEIVMTIIDMVMSIIAGL